MQFAGEFTRGVIADYMQLRVFLGAIAVIFACNFPGIFACVCNYFCLRLAGIFICHSSVFACKLHVFLAVNACNFAY